jgi:hypothetical protein
LDATAVLRGELLGLLARQCVTRPWADLMMEPDFHFDVV